MSLESSDDPRRRRLLDDPLAIRALAHPVRLDLQSLLGWEGPMTAAEAARRLGISQALASHHLRQLAKYDFVEPAPGKDNRERPWRLVSISQNWSEAELTPEAEAAAGVLEQLMAERALERLAEWQQRRPGEDEVWRRTAGIGRSGVYLTGAELVALEEEVSAAINRYVDARPMDDKSTRPPGSRLVDITRIVVVLPEPEEPEDQR
jgi:DNA-binding transcriptional ArsR family regulator